MSTRQLEIESLIKHLGTEILPKNARLILFGSQARDEATPNSDWDLLILLEGEKVSNEAKSRINTMVNSNDGFVIAESDLKLRGPGDIYGTRQSGLLDLKLADLAQDEAIVKVSRDDAFKLLDEDPKLEKPENKPTALFLSNMKNSKNLWGKIS